MKYYAYIAIERKEAILDPQGKAIEHALESLGFREIENTRVGKLIRLKVEASSIDTAKSIAESAAEKLLANPIMETFSIIDVTDEPVLHSSLSTLHS
jgi:phosphoribosylformylglycinamidine synthase PurS subunit